MSRVLESFAVLSKEGAFPNGLFVNGVDFGLVHEVIHQDVHLFRILTNERVDEATMDTFGFMIEILIRICFVLVQGERRHSRTTPVLGNGVGLRNSRSDFNRGMSDRVDHLHSAQTMLECRVQKRAGHGELLRPQTA